jgi:hypothetical protein
MFINKHIGGQNQGCHASGRPRQRPQDVRTCPTTPRTSTGRHAVHHSTWRTAIQPPDGHPTAGRPLRPSVGWRTAAPSAGRGGGRPAGGRPGGPLRLGRPPGAVLQGPSAQSKLWSPIIVDLEVRLRRVIPFWNVQVMLYTIGY